MLASPLVPGILTCASRPVLTRALPVYTWDAQLNTRESDSRQGPASPCMSCRSLVRINAQTFSDIFGWFHYKWESFLCVLHTAERRIHDLCEWSVTR